MTFAGSLGRASAALVLLTACGGGALIARGEASTPAPVWRDVAQVNVLCLVQGESGVVQGGLHDRLCKSVRDAAAAGSPAPVRIIALGDPAVLSADSVTLLTHASVERGQIVLSIRPFRSATEQLLFSAPPRAVPLAGRNSELQTAIAAALSETLPWLSRPAGSRPIR
jgi:hypothetical protein